MAITHEFEYFKPSEISDAVGLLMKFERAEILAGGTDLVNILKEQAKCTNPTACIETLQAVVDIKGLNHLRTLALEDGRLKVGALVTFTELMESPLVKAEMPVLPEVAATVASVGVRNRATMAGNICSGVPCMDSGPVLRLYDAEVVLEGPEGTRVVPISQWFVHVRTTDIRKGEILTRMEIPIPAGGHGSAYVKLRRYQGEDLAQASVCVMALPEHKYRVAFGAVSPVPIRSARLEQLLEGHPVTDELIARAQELIPGEIAPITDVRATAEYRTHMVKVMFERGLKAAVSRLAGDGPAYGSHLI